MLENYVLVGRQPIRMEKRLTSRADRHSQTIEARRVTQMADHAAASDLIWRLEETR